MIIQCTNCYKKFEVSSTLIPDTGRNIQCGSCNFKWFFKKDDVIKDSFIQKISVNTEIEQKNTKQSNLKRNRRIDTTKLVREKKPTKKNYPLKTIKKQRYSEGKLTRFLSYLIVGIISFASLIIILDTFKSPLENIFPNLELILFNLFETIKDILLFLKNLIL